MTVFNKLLTFCGRIIYTALAENFVNELKPITKTAATSHSAILAVAGPALAHLTRVLSVAEVLRSNGVTIHVATDGTPWLPIAAHRGYPIEVLPAIVDRAGLGAGSLGLPDAIVHAAIEADLALLRRLQPRFVLLDWRPSMRLAAALCGIPVVAITNAHVTRTYSGPLAAPERHPLTRLLGRSIADRLMPLLSPLFYRRWARPYQAYARQHGHAGWPDLRGYLVGDITLYPDLPMLAPTHPGSGCSIGPLAHYPLPFDPLPPLRPPVLYVTLGSVPATEFTTALIRTIDGWQGSVVATRGGRGGNWPALWISADYVDPAQISAQAGWVAWLFHAGNGSSYQLLRLWGADPARCAGAVALPFHVEQQWNAHNDPAAAFQDFMPDLDSPAGGVPVQNLQCLSRAGDRHRCQQQPFDRLHTRWGKALP